jgi:arsenate reductase-like glutaredoxin family protein
MKKIYHLSSCSTCQRILKELAPLDNFELQDIKTKAITVPELAEMKALAGTYETLFSRRAMLYKARNLNEKKLAEADYRDLILDHYTFLKRPVIIVDNSIFIGNSKKVVEAAKQAILP